MPAVFALALAAASISALVPARAWAGDGPTGAFPRLDASARGAALAGNLAALAQGGEGVFYNPAGLLDVSRRELSFSYADLFNLGLVTHSAALFAWPILGKEIRWDGGRIHKEPLPPPATRAVGLGVTDIRGELSEGSYQEMQLALSLAWRLALGFRGGATYRYLRAQGDPTNSGGHGFALDFGVLRPVGSGTLGITGANVASSTNWAPDPTTRTSTESELSEPLTERWNVGLAWPFLRGALTLAVQGEWTGSSFAFHSVGGAAEWRGPLILRGGVRSREDELGSHVEPSAGAGFRIRGFRFDYGWLGSGRDLGATHRWSGSIDL